MADEFEPDPATIKPAAAPAPEEFEPDESTIKPAARVESAPERSTGDQLKGIGHAALMSFKDFAGGLVDANRFAAQAIAHPVDTFGNGANVREVMRGVNSNIPFANTLVEKAGGPPAVSPEDQAAASPGAQSFGTVAGLPVASMVGGIAGRGLEAASPLLTSVADSAAARQAARLPAAPVAEPPAWRPYSPNAPYVPPAPAPLVAPPPATMASKLIGAVKRVAAHSAGPILVGASTHSPMAAVGTAVAQEALHALPGVTKAVAGAGDAAAIKGAAMLKQVVQAAQQGNPWAKRMVATVAATPGGPARLAELGASQ